MTGEGGATDHDVVAAWRDFATMLADAGDLVARASADRPPGVRAEGIRTVARFAALALERCVEHGDPDHPAFFELQGPIRKYMGDSPDQTYRAATIRGDRTYLVHDTLADAVAVEVSVYAGDFGGDGGRRLVGALDDREIERAPDGSYTVTLAPDPAPGNHIVTAPDATSVLIRTYFGDLGRRVRHPMARIERVPPAPPAPMLDPEWLAGALRTAGLFAVGSFAWWLQLDAEQMRPEVVNTLAPLRDDGDLLTPASVRYHSGGWRLGREEALVVTVPPGTHAHYWSAVLMTPWGETVDWRERPAVVVGSTAVREADGSVRIVIAHTDPGVGNWLDTGGHPEGSVSLRWFRLHGDLPEPTTAVVPVGSLRPSGTRPGGS